MKLLWLVAALGSLPGCFYIDPVNERPRIHGVVRKCAVDAPCDLALTDLHRGDAVEVVAQFEDPDGPATAVSYEWEIVACDRGANQCDTDAPLYRGDRAAPSFVVPRALASGALVQLVRVELSLRDNLGALASAFPSFAINDGPALELSGRVRGAVLTADGVSIGAPLELVARFRDSDDEVGDVELDWAVYSPDGKAAYALSALGAPDVVGDTQTVRKQLLAFGLGAWSVRATASDRAGASTQRELTFNVAPDRAPCLGQWQPEVPPLERALPISAPTRFSIPTVTDDLDAYPSLAIAPYGTAAFGWSLRVGNGAFAPLAGTTGNSLELDPRNFAPGELAELRVEVFDRAHPEVSCDASETTCAIEGCLQRQTWRVEMR